MTPEPTRDAEYVRHPAYAIIEKTLWEAQDGKLPEGCYGWADAILHNLGAGGFDVVRLANWVKRNAPIDGQVES